MNNDSTPMEGKRVMDALVLDCSITMSWCFSDEHDDYAKAILLAMPSLHAFVPTRWPLEVTQTLLRSEREGRITEVDSDRFLSLLQSLPITVDDESTDQAFGEGLTLARTHGLSSYDSAYLECAIRLGVPLATRDDKLEQAALAAGVSLYQPPDLT